MKKKKLTIDEYIGIAKTDIIVYIIITIIVFLILLYISYKTNFYYYLFLTLFISIRIIEKIEAYNNLKNIKEYLIQNNILDKIGKIEYWNDRYYFLTDKYIIIKQNGIINSFKYSEIERIYKEIYRKLDKMSYTQEYLHIVTNNNEFKILINSTILVSEDFKDISDYLIEKNPNIKLDKTINNTQNNIFKNKKR